ncbi:hypothetical protein [Nostoc sp.]|uniref:hypothetical protein n=1 Tax=Nostoc sp. TaxID=1180 RepID=UPI002FFA3875
MSLISIGEGDQIPDFFKKSGISQSGKINGTDHYAGCQSINDGWGESWQKLNQMGEKSNQLLEKYLTS